MLKVICNSISRNYQKIFKKYAKVNQDTLKNIVTYNGYIKCKIKIMFIYIHFFIPMFLFISLKINVGLHMGITGASNFSRGMQGIKI